MAFRFTYLPNPNRYEKVSFIQIESQYRKLFITAISPNDGSFIHSLNFVINGITDNVVGYVFIKDEKDIPDMSDDGIIMLKSIW